MRLRLLTVLAAVTSFLALATLPAHAAIYPSCTVRLVAAEAGTSDTCTTAHPGINGLILRTLDVQVVAGTVTATVTCGTESKSTTVAGPGIGSVTVIQWRGLSCTNSVHADTDLATATGVSSYTVTFVGV